MIKTVATAYFVIMASMGSEQEALNGTYDSLLQCEMQKEQIQKTNVNYTCEKREFTRTYECGRPIYRDDVSWTGRIKKVKVSEGCQEFTIRATGEKIYWPMWLDLGHLTSMDISRKWPK